MVKKIIEPPIYWISLIGAVFVMFVSSGYLMSYGLTYLELLDKYDQGPERTATVGTVFAIFLVATSPLVGLLIDSCGAWVILIAGAIAGAIGALLAAFAPTLTLVIVGYGVFIGWSNNAGCLAAATAVAQYFSHNRTLALGILYSGVSLGSVVFPLLFRTIVTVYTLRGVFIFIAGFKLNFVVTALLFYAGKHERLGDNMLETNMNTELEPLISSQELHHQKDSSFTAGHVHKKYILRLTSFLKLFCTLRILAVCLWDFTYVYALNGYVMYFPLYAEELHLTEFKVASLLSIFGASDFLGKIVMGFLAGLPWVSKYTLTSVNLIIVAFLTIPLPNILVSGPVYYLCVCHMVVIGFFAGGLFCLEPAFVVDAVGLENAGTGLGLTNVCLGVALLLPSNLYGFLKVSTGTYVWVPYLSGASFVIAAIAIQIGHFPSLWKRWFG